MFLGISYLILARIYVDTLIPITQIRKLVSGHNISRTEPGFNQCLFHPIPELLTTEVGIPGGREQTLRSCHMDGCNCEVLRGKGTLSRDVRK